MAEIKPRPPMKLSFPNIAKDMQILRIEMYRTLNRRMWEFWKPKYKVHYLALTETGVYDITEQLREK